MSFPNYSYCKAHCLGKMKGCPHYLQAHKPFKVCFHYKLLDNYAGHIINFTEADLSRLEEIARKAGV